MKGMVDESDVREEPGLLASIGHVQPDFSG